MKKRSGEPWVAADEYGRGLKAGLGVNLLVKEIERAVRFQTEVLDASAIYADVDFAVMQAGDTQWMLHADHTYLDNPMTGIIAGVEARGVGAELRLYGRDPDEAEAVARAAGHVILAGAMDKPHGLREAMIIDDDGYVWVPGRALVQPL